MDIALNNSSKAGAEVQLAIHTTLPLLDKHASLLVTGILLILLMILHKAVGPKELPLPPGPKPLPLIGNLHQVPKAKSWFHFYQWSKQHGPVMHLSMAGQSLIILSSNEAAQDLLNKKGNVYSDRPRMVMAGELVTRGMHMLLRPYDAQYRLHQRMEAPLLNARAAKHYTPLQDIESQQLLFDRLQDFDKYGEQGTEPHHHHERTMASFIYNLNYGYRLVTGHEKSIQDAKRVQEEFSRTGSVGAYIVDSFPVLNYLPRFMAPWKREGDELYKLEHDLHVGNMKRGLENRGWNFTKHFDQECPEAKGMPEEEVAFDLGIMADAALDTSTVALDWLTVSWILHGRSTWVPKAQSLLDSLIGRDRLPQIADRPNLPFIEAIVNETLRWRAPVIAGVPHFTKTEDTYMGYRIPANSIVLPNLFAVTRDTTVFGDDVEDFRPERWIGDDGTLREDLPLTAFGFGRRICTGRHIARNGLFLNVARLLWAFDVEAGKGGEMIGDMDCTEGFTSLPYAFKAVFRPRGQWVRDVIEELGTTHGVDHRELLDRAGRERRVQRM